MTTEALTSVRDEYKERTRTRILDAAIHLVTEHGEEPVTIADVATRAGVTDRTVYRHFESRDGLIRAVWKRMQERVGSEDFPHTADALINSPKRLFPRFDRSRELVRASVHSNAGIELRLRSNEQRQQAMIDCVRDAFPDADEQGVRRRAAVAQLIYSADAWDVLARFWDLDGEEAGAVAAEALEILLGRRDAADWQP